MDGIRMEQFPFRVLDYKAGEAWLNELGAAGWRLEGIEKGRLRFRRTAEPVSYAVELEQFLGCLAERDRTSADPAPSTRTRPWRRSGSPGSIWCGTWPGSAAGWP